MRVAGTRCYQTLRHPRGMVLITATWIAIALAAVVLVLCREMMVESMTAKHHLSQAKADAAELGMEQYVLSVMAMELIEPGYSRTRDWELRQIGDCWAWVLTYNPDSYTADDERYHTFGLTDEAGKIDLNTASYEMLSMLPGMTEDLAYQILDWVDADDEMAGGLMGAETPEYQVFNYRAKNAPFESVEELNLLLALSYEEDAQLYLHNADRNRNFTIDPDEESDSAADFSLPSLVGMAPYVTVYGMRATTFPAASTNNDAAGASVISGGVTSGSSTEIPIADVNDATRTNLQTMLETVLGQQRGQAILTATNNQQQGGGGGGGGGGGAAQTQTVYYNLWDWASQMQTRAQLTLEEFQAIYLYLICTFATTQPATQQAAATAPVGGIDNGTAATTSQPTTRVGRVNVNTAPLAVLMSLPGFEEADAYAILDYRIANFSDISALDPAQVPNIAWLMDPTLAIDIAKLVQAGSYLTGSSTVYSAEIVTVSPDGRAFKRVKIVVDSSTGTPRIIYRRDLSKEGWPLDLTVREQLRKGEELERIGPPVYY